MGGSGALPPAADWGPPFSKGLGTESDGVRPVAAGQALSFLPSAWTPFVSDTHPSSPRGCAKGYSAAHSLPARRPSRCTLPLRRPRAALRTSPRRHSSHPPMTAANHSCEVRGDPIRGPSPAKRAPRSGVAVGSKEVAEHPPPKVPAPEGAAAAPDPPPGLLIRGRRRQMPPSGRPGTNAVIPPQPPPSARGRRGSHPAPQASAPPAAPARWHLWEALVCMPFVVPDRPPARRQSEPCPPPAPAPPQSTPRSPARPPSERTPTGGTSARTLHSGAPGGGRAPGGMDGFHLGNQRPAGPPTHPGGLATRPEAGP